jgi:hypothetical protein
MKLYVLAILVRVGIAGAAELDAVLFENKTYAGSNCREQGGPTYYVIMVAITNPSATTSLRVTYLYYNSSSGTYGDGGKVCDVKPAMRESCEFKVYTVTGGQNKSEEIPFKVIGDFGTSETYERELGITVNHYIGAFEQSVIDKLAIARGEYERVYQRYGSCYNISRYELLDAEYKLSICDISGALKRANDAITKIHQDEGFANATCSGAQPQQNGSQPPPPPIDQNQTSQNETPANQTPPTSEDNLTGITSAIAKGCMSFFILTVLLVIAVWSERKTSA